MKRGRSRLAGGAVIVLGAAGWLWAQTADEKPAPLVVRVGVDLVQLDAVVVDKKGQHVTDLGAQDFEVLQEGKPREIVSKDTGKPVLRSRVRLVRQGQAVFDHDLAGVQVMQSLEVPSGDRKHKPVPGFVVAGTFTLPKELEPGEYAVQVAVVDEAVTKEKNKAAAQWTSLEVAAP